MLTKDEVIWLFRIVLEREPDTANVVEHFQNNFADLASARTHLLDSNEFLRKKSQNDKHFLSIDPDRGLDSTLAVACILKDEEKHIEDMLKSILPIARFVAIVDTGSKDQTLAIARRVLQSSCVMHKIVEAPFINFSHARNQALDLVPQDIAWTLMLDADERIVSSDFASLRTLIGCSIEIDAWSLPRYNFLDSDKVKPVHHYPDYQKRLIRNRLEKPIRYIGLVHETLHDVQRLCLAPMADIELSGNAGGPHIHHLGLVDQIPEREARKAALYADLTSLANR